MFGRWLDRGERELQGATGDGYLQGMLLSETTKPCFTVATERRIVMLEDVTRGRAGRLRAKGITFEVPWSMVKGYWTGVLPLPPDLWRAGPEGEVIVFTLDPLTAGGQDLVVRVTSPAWLEATRAMGVPEVRD